MIGLKQHATDIIRLSVIILVSDLMSSQFPEFDATWKIVLSRVATVLLTAILVFLGTDRLLGIPKLTLAWLEDNVVLVSPRLHYRHGANVPARAWDLTLTYASVSLLGWIVTRRLRKNGTLVRIAMRPEGILRCTKEWEPAGASIDVSATGLTFKLGGQIDHGPVMNASISLQPLGLLASGLVLCTYSVESPKTAPWLMRHLVHIDANIRDILLVRTN